MTGHLAFKTQQLKIEGKSVMGVQKAGREKREEVNRELKRFTTQEMAGDFVYLRRHRQSLRNSRGTYNGSRSLQQPFRMRSSATVSSMTRNNSYYPDIAGLFFSRG